MNVASRRAVITGVGVISPIGTGSGPFWDSLSAGRQGFGPITRFDPSELPVRIAAEVPDFSPKDFLDKKEVKASKVWARTIQFGVCAAKLARLDTGLAPGGIDPERFGVEFGTGLIASDLDDLAPAAKASSNCKPDSLDLKAWGRQGIAEIPPLWMLKYLPNMPACHVSILQDARGPNNSHTLSDVASLLAVGEAYRGLARGLADFYLVGGSESKLNPLSMVRHVMFQNLSRSNDRPAEALRPFDRGRAGTVLGEGGACFGLESLGHARQRGARIYAEVVAFAAGFDKGRTGSVLARVIKRALDEADISPADVDHVNAAGFGTVADDLFEAAALREVFGGWEPPIEVFAGKGHFGSLGAGGSALELACSALALHHGQLPGTLNHTDPDPGCGLAVHRGAPRPVERDHAVKVSFTDRGQCACVVLKRWAGE